MNSISRLIANQDPDYILLSSNDRRDLVYTVILYMFRVIDSPTMSRTLKGILKWEGQTCIDFRKTLQITGGVQKDLKLYIYARASGVLNAEAKRGLSISVDDETLVKSLLRSDSANALRLKDKCKYYNRHGYTPKTLATFDAALGTAIQLLDVYCKKFVNKKFLFLTQSGQLGKEDIRQGLLEFGIYAIYKAYPVIKTSLHMLNIAKTAIHNRGMNVIKEQTTSSRSRVSRQKDGTFAGNLVSLGQLLVADNIPDMGFGLTTVATALVTGLDGRSVEGEQFNDVNRRRDLEETVSVIFTKLKTDKPKQFLTLLMGVHDERFSSWLGQPNDVYCSKSNRKVYANKVRDYLGIPVPKARDFFITLRDQLKDFRN